MPGHRQGSEHRAQLFDLDFQHHGRTNKLNVRFVSSSAEQYILTAQSLRILPYDRKYRPDDQNQPKEAHFSSLEKSFGGGSSQRAPNLHRAPHMHDQGAGQK